MSAAEQMTQAMLEELRAIRAELAAMRQSSRPMLTRSAAAKLFGVRKEALYGWVASGEVRSVPGPGGRPMITQEEIERLQRVGLPQAKRRGRPKKIAPPASEGDKIRAMLKARSRR